MSNNTVNKNDTHIKIITTGKFNQFQAKWPLDAFTIEKSIEKESQQNKQNKRYKTIKNAVVLNRSLILEPM